MSNLTNTQIKDTYQRLLQVNNGEILNGLGSPVSANITSITASNGFKGNLDGTALSSSFALTASFLSGNVESASFAQTASYVENAQTASFTLTASYVENAQTASYVTFNNVEGLTDYTSSVSSSIVELSSSFLEFSSSYNTGSFTGSFEGNFIGSITSASLAQTSSYIEFNNIDGLLDYTSSVSASIAELSSDFEIVSGSYVEASSSFSASITSLSSSFDNFSASYNSGSFSGSFHGDGSGLTGIISSSFAVSSSFALTASYALNGGGDGASVIISASAPVSESVGTLWFNTESDTGNGGELFILMDETSSNWIPVHDKFVDQAVSSSYAVSSSIASHTSEWVNGGTITIGAITTAPTKGTAVYDKVRYRRVTESTYEVDYNFAQSTPGTAGNGHYLFSLPSGLTWGNGVIFDTSNTLENWINASIPGPALLMKSSADFMAKCIVTPYSNTQFRLIVQNSGGNLNPMGSGWFDFSADGLSLKFRFYTTV